MRKDASGFTLLELMIAGGLAGLIAVAAFAAVTNMQQATGAQMEATTVYSSGRFGLDMMVRDVRMAGDSSELFANYCIRNEGNRHTSTAYACPAILEAHPWRVVLTMNNWTPAASVAGDEIGVRSPFGAGATPPTRNSMLWDRPDNTVAYEFVPMRAGNTVVDLDENLRVRAPTGAGWFARRVIRGRIDRIVNPLALAADGTSDPLATPPMRSVLVENVVLDNAMRCSSNNPSNSTTPADCDPRADFALFSYRLLARDSTFLEMKARTSASRMFLSPPLNFYPVGRPTTQIGSPVLGSMTWGMPAAVAAVTGLKADTSGEIGDADRLYDKDAANLDGYTRESFDDAAGAAAPFNPEVGNSIIRLIYDRQRIRAVRISFKVYSGREDPTYPLGLDLDGHEGPLPLAVGPGTSPLFHFESEAELKVFNSRAALVDL